MSYIILSNHPLSFWLSESSAKPENIPGCRFCTRRTRAFTSAVAACKLELLTCFT